VLFGHFDGSPQFTAKKFTKNSKVGQSIADYRKHFTANQYMSSEIHHRRNKQCIYIYLNFSGLKQVDNNPNQLFSPKNNRNCHAQPRPSVKTQRIRRF
jgi:hypothetical protein